MLNPLATRRILKKGIAGRARIEAMTMPPRGAAKFNLGMTLQVHVAGQPPYEVQDQWIVSAKTPLGFGMVLPVKVDPNDPQRVAVDWGAHVEAAAEADQVHRGSLGDMGPVGPMDQIPTESAAIDSSDNPELRDEILQALGAAGFNVAAGGSTGDDTIDALERLVKLRDAGALTEKEFRAQKRRILGED
jgi:hypothetical protein